MNHFVKTAIFCALLITVATALGCGNSNTPTVQAETPKAETIALPQQVQNDATTAGPIVEEPKPVKAETNIPKTQAPKSVTPKVLVDPDKILEKQEPAGKQVQPQNPKPVETIQEQKQENPLVKEESAPQNAEPVKVVPPPAPAVTHEAWDALLQKYVSAQGKVNYKGLKADKKALESYTQLLSANPPAEGWSRNEKLAYWINAYNAFTVKLIVDNYPLKSIMDLSGGKPWDQKWIKIGDKTYSLNNIENDIIRPQFKEARIHFAVNCAATSCPALLNRAWTAGNLSANLEKQTKNFVNNSSFNKIGAEKIQISKIFEWYAADFGNLIEFLNKYSDTKIKATAKIEYLEYQWGLNE